MSDYTLNQTVGTPDELNGTETLRRWLDRRQHTWIHAAASSLCRFYGMDAVSALRRRVTLQLHRQTTSWWRHLYANVLSFFAAVFHQFLGIA